MNILHISCSPRGTVSESHRLALRIIEHLQRAHPRAVRIERALGRDAPPFIDGTHATALGAAQTSPSEALGEGTLAVSDMLIRELEQADAVVIGTPMHNFSVPATLKLWIDHIVRVRRSFDMGAQGKLGRLRNRPVLVAVSSGGAFSGERARQPDFLTPYLRAVLAVIGLRDVSFFTVEGTGGGADAVEQARARAERALQAHFDTV
ncbi:FMN-dependent NADH-azoreductase [Hydrogenophaga sp.]|uniref:FMN-dependent NADH-azoreductase n=1 Tax=Hydrogenophaga sp. TaxID=1904254 RepID=UPI0027243680|nr:NAD(P)H-dependent oxidoreductase [Hydrogenophaga sp.]MDO9435231.1 NAD(P)H-dependent oxidoreductase [Hydrogenophaga sp.]